MPSIIKKQDIKDFLKSPRTTRRKDVELFKTLTLLKKRNIIDDKGNIDRRGNSYLFPNRYIDEEKVVFIFATITVILFYLFDVHL